MQCRHALKPDGLLLGAMLGGNSLQELRIACALAEQEMEGGVASRISPLTRVRRFSPAGSTAARTPPPTLQQQQLHLVLPLLPPLLLPKMLQAVAVAEVAKNILMDMLG